MDGRLDSRLVIALMSKLSDHAQLASRFFLGLAAFLATVAVVWFGLALIGHTLKAVTVALGADPIIWKLHPSLLLEPKPPSDREAAISLLCSISIAVSLFFLVYFFFRFLGFCMVRLGLVAQLILLGALSRFRAKRQIASYFIPSRQPDQKPIVRNDD